MPDSEDCPVKLLELFVVGFVGACCLIKWPLPIVKMVLVVFFYGPNRFSILLGAVVFSIRTVYRLILPDLVLKSG